jgi:alpha-tubulin suppressor-like RCC1 family protein
MGDNQSGQLGDNTVVRKSSPIQTVTGGVNWQQMACSGFLTVGATAGVKTDGTLWNWGLNTNGNLGDNTTNQQIISSANCYFRRRLETSFYRSSFIGSN